MIQNELRYLLKNLKIKFFKQKYVINNFIDVNSYFLKNFINKFYKIRYQSHQIVSLLMKTYSYENLQIFFLRKTEIFSKNRYARNRQTCRVIVYWTLWLNVVVIYGLYFYFYQFVFNFGYIWWGLFFLILSFWSSRIIKYRFYNPLNIYKESKNYINWVYLLCIKNIICRFEKNIQYQDNFFGYFFIITKQLIKKLHPHFREYVWAMFHEFWFFIENLIPNFVLTIELKFFEQIKNNEFLRYKYCMYLELKTFCNEEIIKYGVISAFIKWVDEFIALMFLPHTWRITYKEYESWMIFNQQNYNLKHFLSICGIQNLQDIHEVKSALSKVTPVPYKFQIEYLVYPALIFLVKKYISNLKCRTFLQQNIRRIWKKYRKMMDILMNFFIDLCMY